MRNFTGVLGFSHCKQGALHFSPLKTISNFDLNATSP